MASNGFSPKNKDTFFAPAERASDEDLNAGIAAVTNNPVFDTVLTSVGGLVAVLNAERQVLAMNDAFMQMLGIHDPAGVLGLRPGEVVRCVHAHETPGGCGTTEYCSTCGAAVAIVASFGYRKPIEKLCALTVEKDGGTHDMVLRVRAHPLTIEGQTFLLLFLQDITSQEERASLERTFYHDISNIVGGIVGASELLSVRNTDSRLASIVHAASLRLRQEIAIQKFLSCSESARYHLMWKDTTVQSVAEELNSFFKHHPVAGNKMLHFSEKGYDIIFKTDSALLLRILRNMITNAFEATDEGGTIKVWVNRDSQGLSFFVWNEHVISEDVSRRIFQRNFSTKKEDGRGFGTYSMKLFGETVLGGNVSFVSSEKDGTVFCFTHPVQDN